MYSIIHSGTRGAQLFVSFFGFVAFPALDLFFFVIPYDVAHVPCILYYFRTPLAQNLAMPVTQ